MTKILIAAVSVAAILAASSVSAQDGRRITRPHHVLHMASAYEAAYPVRSLTIHGRSYLDAGVAAPTGTEDRYVADSTTFNEPVHSLFFDRFDSGLPRPLEVPGRDKALFNFETPALP